MLVHLLFFVLGLALLVGGGEALVRGAAALAARLGVSPIIIGLTTVAFGTSAPELAVSLLAAVGGSSAIAFGNVVGSNIANIGLLLGLTALLRPITVHSQIVVREIPMLLLCCAATVLLCLDRALGTGDDVVQRGDGLMLLLLFGLFLYYTARDALRQRSGDVLLEEAEKAPALGAHLGMGAALALVAAGLVALGLGGRWLVEAAVAIARAFDVSDVVIGATVVAVGTSLPELSTSMIAARRGLSDLAIGNIIGSNIFNLLFVLGSTATVLPVAVPASGLVDLLAMTAFAVVLLPMAITHQRTITRGEGVVLLAGYLAYVAWQLVR